MLQPLNPLFATMMRQLRDDFNLTTKQAADNIGCCPATITHWEGEPKLLPRLHHMEGIIATYDVVDPIDLYDAAGYPVHRPERKLRLVK